MIGPHLPAIAERHLTIFFNKIKNVKIKKHTFVPTDTLIISWFKDLNKEQIQLISKAFIDKYYNYIVG